jgi:RHS repeat-associated protein
MEEIGSMHMSLRSNLLTRASALVALTLCASMVNVLPVGPAAAVDERGVEVRSVDGNPLGEARDKIDKFTSPALPDRLSELPHGSAETDPATAWTDLDGIPVEVRDSNTVTVLPETSNEAATTETLPATEDEAAPPVKVSIRPTDEKSTPGLLLELRPQSSVADQFDDSTGLRPSTPSTTESADGASDGPELTSPSEPSASDGAEQAPEESQAERDGAAAVQVRISYSKFRYAFAGDWGGRLQVVAYPACFATTPDEPECGEGVAVPSVNDLASETLSFTTTDLDRGLTTEIKPLEPTAAEPSVTPSALRRATSSSRVAEAAFVPAETSSAGTVYLLMAGSSGETGDYKAQPLQPSASWQVGEGSGEFAYSYPFQTPAPAVGGPSPSLSLDYSSGSVDGRNKAENGQASMVGIGWDMVPGYISRSYAACDEDGMAGKGDLCWKTDAAGNLITEMSLVLNGRASKLLRIGTSTRFRLQDDPGWQVDKVLGAQGDPTLPDNTDDTNEAFKVRAPDGTTYWFGWGHDSDSTLTVPVFGNNAGEPCHQSTVAASWCMEAWRWNLDRVYDRNGNRIEYSYNREINYYARYGTNSNHQEYDRGGYLTDIKYGISRGGTSGAYSQVAVTTKPRCISALADPDAACSGSTGPRAEPDDWPDVPGFLICDSNDTCTNKSPTFFSTRRYDAVSTRRWTGVTYLADTYQMIFQFPEHGGEEGLQDLWLQSVQQTGEGATDVVPPPVQFAGVWLTNRVDIPSGGRPFAKLRVDVIRTETGGWIDVVYGHDDNRECTAANVNSATQWGSQRECYPRKLGAEWGWWHKYVVKRVALGDNALGYRLGQAADPGPNLGRLRVYDYEYAGLPGWRYRHDPLTPSSDETWDDWRGYPTVIVHTRKVGSDQVPDADGSDVARRMVKVFRGLSGTRLNNTATLRTEMVSTEEGDYYDSGWMVGRVAEQTLMTADGATISRTNSEYGQYDTASNPYGLDGHFVYLQKSIMLPRVGAPKQTRTYTVDDGGSDHRDGFLGAVLIADDDRGTASPADDVIACTDWSVNSTSALRVPKTVKTNVGSCTATGDAALGQADYYYDGSSTLGAGLTDGDPTLTAAYKSADSRIWTQRSFDTYGRLRTESLPYYDGTAAGDIKYTTTTYNPGTDANDLILKVETKGPTVDADTPALKSTSTLTVHRGVVSAVVDADGQTTTIGRDGLGRVTWVNEPGNSSGVHSIDYAYVTSQFGPSSVRTQTLRDGTTADTGYQYFDGWGRPLETQELNQAGNGRVVNATAYDEAGRVRASMPAVYKNTTAFSLLNPNPVDVTHYSATTYDAADRPTVVSDMTYGSANWSTRYTYEATADIVASTPPGTTTDSIAKTRTDLNAMSQPVKVTQYGNGVSADATPDHSFDDGYAEYTYTPTGALNTIKTPQSATAGDLVSYDFDYDWLGRRTEVHDPDTGTTTYEYDARGNTILVNDAMPDDTTGVIETKFDVLDRQLLREQVTSNGTRTTLAQWEYDDPAVDHSLGRLTKATSFTKLGEFSSSVDGFDVRGNPLSTTEAYPGSLTGENAGGQATKTVTFGYNQLGQVANTTYPASPKLPLLTVNTSYGRNGLFAGMSTDDGRTLGLPTYDNSDRPSSLLSQQSASDPTRIQRNYLWTDTDRLASLAAVTGVAGATVDQLSLSYAYDILGNPLRVSGTRKDTASATGTTAAWCYSYDGISRLTGATTGIPIAGSNGCTNPATAGQVTPVTGAKYALTYSYAQTRLAEVDNGTKHTAYTYGTGMQPHAPAKLTIGGSILGSNAALPVAGTLTYDVAGRVIKWKPGGSAVNYIYDAQGNLTKADDTNIFGTDTEHAYDTGGIRVARKVGNAVVVYVAGTEISKTGAAAATTRRTFTAPSGTPLAIQAGDGSDAGTDPDWTWLFADGQATVRMSKNAGTGASQHHTYYPFGDPISNPDLLPGEKGFVGKTHDPNGAVRLDHRSYDPGLDALTTPDPLMAPMDPQRLNAYAYARNNPVSFADPSGLDICPPPLKHTPFGVPCPTSGGMPAGLLGLPGLTTEQGNGLSGEVDRYQREHKDASYAEALEQSVFHLARTPSDDSQAYALAGCEGFPSNGACHPAGFTWWDVLLLPFPEFRVAEIGGAALLRLAGRTAVREAVAETGMAGVLAAGRAGEELAGIVKNTGRIPSVSGSAAYRIPDELNSLVLGEVKNTLRLNYTNQLRDFAAYAGANNLRFNLYVRVGTQLSRPLQQAVDSGAIKLIRNLP